MRTWRQGAEVEFTSDAGVVLRARCLKYPLLKVLTDPPTSLFLRRDGLSRLVRVGEAPLTAEERRAGEGWNYVSEAAGIAGTPPVGVRPVLIDPPEGSL